MTGLCTTRNPAPVRKIIDPQKTAVRKIARERSSSRPATVRSTGRRDSGYAHALKRGDMDKAASVNQLTVLLGRLGHNLSVMPRRADGSAPRVALHSIPELHDSTITRNIRFFEVANPRLLRDRPAASNAAGIFLSQPRKETRP